jgi:hypothetical protein
MALGWQRLLVVGLLSSWSAGVRAAPAATGSAPTTPGVEDAQALFESGVRDMLAGNLETGCPALARSQELQPMPGTLFTLAECEARWGKSTAALAHYEQFVAALTRMDPKARAKHEERRVVAARQIEALRLSSPSLTIMVPPAAPAGTEVTLDGKPMDRAWLQVALRVDPGDHVLTISAPGHEPRSTSESLAEGQSRTITLELGRSTARAAPPPPPEPAPTPAAYAWGGVVGGVGLAAVVVGAITGGLALGKRATVDEHCTDRLCDQQGLDAAGSGKTLGDVSTATLVIGGAALVTGVVLLVVGSQEDTTTAMWLTPQGFRWRF